MTPNYEKAALKAAEILVKYNINTAPISPIPIFMNTPGVLVLSFSEISNHIGIARRNIVQLFGLENQDAVTSVLVDDGKLKYLIAYNQQLPFNIIQRSLARELGHIILGHDDSIPFDVRDEEAKCFAKHFLCPRALIHSLQEAGSVLTVESVGSVTGCYGRCQSYMRNLPGTHVPAELNRQIKKQFEPYVQNFIDYQSILIERDTSPLADFGTFMDGYEE